MAWIKLLNSRNVVPESLLVDHVDLFRIELHEQFPNKIITFEQKTTGT